MKEKQDLLDDMKMREGQLKNVNKVYLFLYSFSFIYFS